MPAVLLRALVASDFLISIPTDFLTLNSWAAILMVLLVPQPK
jgi:hypothetical protein